MVRHVVFLSYDRLLLISDLDCQLDLSYLVLPVNTLNNLPKVLEIIHLLVLQQSQQDQDLSI